MSIFFCPIALLRNVFTILSTTPTTVFSLFFRSTFCFFQNFLNRCEHGRFIVRRSSMPGCLALSHKLPTLDIGHALIQSGANGWTITGSDKSFSTVEGLLRSRTLQFPKPGEYGAPNQMTVKEQERAKGEKKNLF